MRVLQRFLGHESRPVPVGPEQAAFDTAAGKRRSLLTARQRLAEVFTPTRPLSGSKLQAENGQGSGAFVGRDAERERIMRAFVEDRSHVAIFGERGRGKTSLANVVLAQARTAGFDVASHVCSADSDFDAIMRGLFQDMPRWVSAVVPPDAEGRRSATNLFPASPLRPSDILAACTLLRAFQIILVIDEFDRVVDQDTRTAIADTIKQCSDRGVPLFFMIIGVSDSFEELLGRHASIQRCVTRIGLSLLTRAEAEQLVARGGHRAGLDVPAAVRSCIATLAHGVPYMVQLLALRAGQAALDSGRSTIRGGDVMAAIEAAVAEADPRVTSLYDRVTNVERDLAVLGVLRAAAAGQQDDLGRFRVEVRGSSLLVAGVRVVPAAWRRVLESGAVRPVSGEGSGLYTFGEAMLAQMVLMRAVLSRKAPALRPADLASR